MAAQPKEGEKTAAAPPAHPPTTPPLDFGPGSAVATGLSRLTPQELDIARRLLGLA
jgi:hypothetical protein